MRNISDKLTVDELNPPDVNLVCSFYMFLASKKGIDILKQNCNIQQ